MICGMRVKTLKRCRTVTWHASFILALLTPLFSVRSATGLVVSPEVIATSPDIDLKLSDYIEQVVERNETLQAQLLEVEAERLKANGEKGIFEPAVTASILREANKRTNNVQEQAAQSGQAFFTERNTLYDGGLEMLIPSGAKVQLGYNLSELGNNVNPNPFASLSSSNSIFTRQYQTFVGITFTQPLLKNAGEMVNMASLRLAAMDSEIAFQQYRRQLMLAISQAEAAYWNLYFSQEQLRFFDQSLALAESVVADAREKMKAGQGSEMDVLEAQSGLALRQTKRNEALQNLYEAVGQVQSLSGALPPAHERTLRAVDVPPATISAGSYPESFQHSFDLNPDLLIQQKKVNEEKLRLNVARRQLLPELNLKGAYGYNGLGATPGDSMEVLETQNFPSWSVGFEVRIPLGGGIKARSDYDASRLSLQEAVASFNATQTQVANALDASLRKMRGWQDSVQSYQTVVEYNEDLLKTQVARLNAGKIEPRKVLEVEADLFEARQSLAQALVQRQRTLLELQLAEGTLLKNRNLELSRDDLRRKTQALLADHSPPLDAFHKILRAPATFTP